MIDKEKVCHKIRANGLFAYLEYEFIPEEILDEQVLEACLDVKIAIKNLERLLTENGHT